MIKIEKITLYHVSMRLKKPFKTSIETLQDRKFLIVEAIDETGRTGWGRYRRFLLRGIQKKRFRHVRIC